MHARGHTDELVGDRNRLAVVVVGLIALGIINSLAFRFPSAYDQLTGFFFIGNVIKVVALIIMLVLVVAGRHSLGAVARYYARRGFKVDEDADRARIGPNINDLSSGLANIVIIAITWPIAVQLVGQLLLIEGTRSIDWIKVLLHVGFALLLVYQLYMIYRPLPPVLDTVGKRSSMSLCPSCGASNSATAKFCFSCGADLYPPQTAAPASLRCPKCGAENKRGAKFCEGCGTALAGT